MTIKGVNGVVGFVNLSTGEIKKIQVPDEVYRNFLGGYGLGVWFLYTHMKPRVDPLGPDNILGIISGLLNASGIPMTGRSMAVGKSPLTGGWGDSNAGGRFGPKLLEAGLDAIFVTGVSEKPVYILIDNGDIHIESASDLWGRNTRETEDELRRRYRGAQVVSIGPAGERLQLIAAIINEYGRAYGRSGLGAVMGSKKLKAIVAVGDKKPEIHDRDLLRQKIKEMLDALKTTRARAYEIWHKYGTISTLDTSVLSGDTPIKNWAGIGVRDYGTKNLERFGTNTVIQDNIKPYGCASCPVSCGAWIRRNTRYGLVDMGHRLEYETASLFGPALLNADQDSVVYVGELCNMYGLDTISTANVVGFAFELYEKGILTEKDVGFPLRWGDPDAVVKLVELIGKAESIGKVLGQGVKRAAEIIGRGAEQYAMHVGGQELPAHHPQFLPGLAITYTADPTPARHTAGGVHWWGEGGKRLWAPFDVGLDLGASPKYDYGDKGRKAAIIAMSTQVENSLGFCQFASQVIYRTLPYIDLIYAVTGMKYTPQELLKVGHRIHTLRQLFNVREGVNPKKDFKLPRRVLEPFPEGPLAGVKLTEEDVERMREQYWETLGWDPSTGYPRRRTVEELGLAEIAGDIINILPP
ncbi:aldehyde ferredoxin oxidoreductase family protein [Vulcanisaeta distributa]|uniref:Aldehyde ferredoxin oxidoreductase n=1 Tax=Vulcanisaeta distributa (strain DSM 14429 / JCM 11212 / NBRC 100878 / IC-017) TaxID=572478 RepID=E1QUG8_VULDI|nr:aldehyde ferredoxin oxidoreductase family protein [Vulcanisaeta distributa]ADN49894.1 Aldehyde ferredoxin oxidoreductase [Vulcanisaeta distributa DSM 14429]